jgi:hypothetical protein
MKKLTHRSFATAELLLIFPAVLFMTALFLRSIQPQEYEPAHSAERIVEWYAARPHTGLWLLMIALPLIVMTAGSAALIRSWRSEEGLRAAARQTLAHLRAHFASFVVLAATAMATGILAVVVLHLITG